MASRVTDPHEQYSVHFTRFSTGLPVRTAGHYARAALRTSGRRRHLGIFTTSSLGDSEVRPKSRSTQEILGRTQRWRGGGRSLMLHLCTLDYSVSLPLVYFAPGKVLLVSQGLARICLLGTHPRLIPRRTHGSALCLAVLPHLPYSAIHTSLPQLRAPWVRSRQGDSFLPCCSPAARARWTCVQQDPCEFCTSLHLVRRRDWNRRLFEGLPNLTVTE